MNHRWIAAVTLAVTCLLTLTTSMEMLAQGAKGDSASSADALAAAAYTGEPVGGFPSWSERLLLELSNRSRSDPAADLAGCPSGNCADAGCYGPMPPLGIDLNLTRSARFHSDEMFRQGYFDHSSHCALPSNIASIYPTSCDGSAGCACTAGAWTDVWPRISLFGKKGTGEIIAVWGGADPLAVYYLWMYENAGSSSCSFSETNGHRWLILKQTSGVGYGNSDAWYTGDFGTGVVPGKIASGAHDPRSGPTVDFWANWYDTAGPKSATLVLDGGARALSLERGTQTNGTWHAQVGNLGTSCHRYYYSFTDSAGTAVTFPATGSYGIGPAASCPDWSSSRTTAVPPPGDANGDDVVNVDDVFYLINYLYSNGPAPTGKGDANGDKKVDVADVFYLVNYLYGGGPAPV